MKRSLAAVCAALAVLAFYSGVLRADSPASGTSTAKSPTADGATKTVLIFAAASLTNVMQELGDAYLKAHGITVKSSFAASSTLARQIENGAPADVFFAADHDWMDYLQKRNLIDAATRTDLLGNHLVLIAPADSTVALKIAPHFALAATLMNGKLATGDPDSVPVGRYAQAALTSLGVWNSVAGKLIRADSVRTALNFVARGEAPLGIVYQTDALVEPKVRVVDRFADDTHAPITYPIALTRAAKPDARAFLDYLLSPAAQVSFQKYGFISPPNPNDGAAHDLSR